MSAPEQGVWGWAHDEDCRIQTDDHSEACARRSATLMAFIQRHRDEASAAARAESDALRAALENACPIDHRRVPPSRCRVIYLGEPDGATCLDRQARAAEPSSRFTPEFRARLVAGEHLCKGCRAMLALGERAALTPSPAEPAAPERCLVCDHVVHPSTEECDCRCVAAPEREP